jgi:hypothetical protein
VDAPLSLSQELKSPHRALTHPGGEIRLLDNLYQLSDPPVRMVGVMTGYWIVMLGVCVMPVARTVLRMAIRL